MGTHKSQSRRSGAPTAAGPAARLGVAIRSRRRELGLTQLRLAELAGCGLAFLYELERGKPSVRLDKVLDVLDILGLSLRLDEGRGGIEIVPPHLRRVEPE